MHDVARPDDGCRRMPALSVLPGRVCRTAATTVSTASFLTAKVWPVDGGEFRVNPETQGEPAGSVGDSSCGRWLPRQLGIGWPQDGSGYGRFTGQPLRTPMVRPFTLSLQSSAAEITGSTLEAVRLFGDVEVGDSYTLSIDEQDVTYTAAAGDTMTDVREAVGL